MQTKAGIFLLLFCTSVRAGVFFDLEGIVKSAFVWLIPVIVFFVVFVKSKGAWSIFSFFLLFCAIFWPAIVEKLK